MSELDQLLLRELAGWDPAGTPVTSVYLAVDGRRYPKKGDYELRLEDLLRRVRAQADALGPEARRSVGWDVVQIAAFVRDAFVRGSTRGLAMFSASAEGLWEEVRLSRPVRDQAVVGARADILPLEAMLQTYRSTCTALVDYEKARLLITELGAIEEVSDVWDDVPNRHDQGGWAQMRMQRHVDDHRQKHLKHVADALFELWNRRSFDHLILSGPAAVVADLERELHDYLTRLVRARLTLPIGTSADEVLERTLEIDEGIEREAERSRVELLAQAARAGDKAVAGLPGTLAALAEGRISEMLVAVDLSAPGGVCPGCGRLTDHGSTCPVCGTALQPISDVVETAVAHAFRSGSRVEPIAEEDALVPLGGIGAFLRF